MIERFLKKYVFDYPVRYRCWLVLLFFLLPILWVGVAIKELWESDPLNDVYVDLWRAFKKGAEL